MSEESTSLNSSDIKAGSEQIDDIEILNYNRFSIITDSQL
jgi:hypothetical protein